MLACTLVHTLAHTLPLLHACMHARVPHTTQVLWQLLGNSASRSDVPHAKMFATVIGSADESSEFELQEEHEPSTTTDEAVPHGWRVAHGKTMLSMQAGDRLRVIEIRRDQSKDAAAGQCDDAAIFIEELHVRWARSSNSHSTRLRCHKALTRTDASV